MSERPPLPHTTHLETSQVAIWTWPLQLQVTMPPHQITSIQTSSYKTGGNFLSDHVGKATFSTYKTIGNFSSGHLDMVTSTSSHYVIMTDHFTSVDMPARALTFHQAQLPF